MSFVRANHYAIVSCLGKLVSNRGPDGLTMLATVRVNAAVAETPPRKDDIE